MVTIKHDDKLQDGSECAFQVLTSFTFQEYLVHVSPHFNYVEISIIRVEVKEDDCSVMSNYIVLSIVQCALLYTTVYGQRRIRVTTLSLPCTSMLNNLFRTADLDTQFACILKQGIWLYLFLQILVFTAFVPYIFLFCILCALIFSQSAFISYIAV